MRGTTGFLSEKLNYALICREMLTNALPRHILSKNLRCEAQPQLVTACLWGTTATAATATAASTTATASASATAATTTCILLYVYYMYTHIGSEPS